MKIRIGFVTNSSSTSYIFYFKGETRKDLQELIKKYKELFNFSYDFYDGEVVKVDYADLVNSLNRERHNSIPCSIENRLLETINEVYEGLKALGEEKPTEIDPYFKYELDHVLGDIEEYETVLEMKNRGMTSVYETEFHDSASRRDAVFDICGAQAEKVKTDELIIKTVNKH